MTFMLVLFGALVVAVAAQGPPYTLSRQSGARAGQQMEKPYLGTWVSTGAVENWEAFIQKLGRDVPSHPSAIDQKSMHKFTKLADDKIRHEFLSLPEGFGFDRVLEFKLNEEVKHTKNGVEMLFKYMEDPQGMLKVDIRIPSKNKVIHEEFRIRGDQLEKTCEVDGVLAKRMFKKEVNPMAASLRQSQSQDKPYLGTWVSTGGVENWEAFSQKLGRDIPSHPGRIDQQSMHKFTKLDNDKIRHEFLILPEGSSGFDRVLEFKLGEEVKHTMNGVDLLFKYTEDPQGMLKVDIRVPSKNKVIHEEFRIRGDQLEKTCEVDGVLAKRMFKKEVNPSGASLPQSRIQEQTQDKPYLGTWISTGPVENLQSFLQKLGRDIPTTHFFGVDKQGKHVITKLPDNKIRHEFSILPEGSTGFDRVLEAKLGEEVKYTKNGVDMFFKYVEDADDKLKVDIRIPSKNKIIHEEFRVTGDQLEKTCEIDGVIAKRMFKKEAGRQ